MKNQEQYTQQLIENKLMISSEEISLYEEAVEKLFDRENISAIDSLIYGFSDLSEDREVMFSTLHAIEYYGKSLDLEIYMNKLLPLLRLLEKDAYEWSETFFLRIMNYI
ncbi:immunity 30 family protein [Sphingobacterium sp. SRCM116780]|uniref:Imm30 family immunity protein n=1 Tax=Sphingobacterium sp. SRCM116780 TaxID=2907623 RepID=UPI001F3920EE|nr:Imm30 family immunity protein [Sphingobacterium sp. SRCM116780]UIR56999.1 immunity 30 family protein [Sphingobacterium sp. SRCM116780]